jgi:hypothetical protein
MKLVRLINMCLNWNYTKIRKAKISSNTFPIKIGLQQGGALMSLLFNFILEYAIRKVQETKEKWNRMEHVRFCSRLITLLVGRKINTTMKNTEALLEANVGGGWSRSTHR